MPMTNPTPCAPLATWAIMPNRQRKNQPTIITMFDWVETQAGSGIEFSAHPNEAEQTVKNAGHAAKMRPAHQVLAEIGANPNDQHQEEQLEGSLPGLNHRAEILQPKHVEQQMEDVM